MRRSGETTVGETGMAGSVTCSRCGTWCRNVERVAAGALAKVPQPDRGRIAERIRSLGVDPRPAAAVKVTGSDAYRVRQGNYRIVYVVEDAVQIVTVTRIGHRRDVYREKR